MKTYKIHLIRHGLTEANEKGLYIGNRTDMPLSAVGKRDLQKKREQKEYPFVGKVYSSPLCRATESAKILYEGFEPTVVEELTEYDFGAFEGQTAAELEKTEEYNDWISGKIPCPPNGEDTNEFIKRLALGINGVVRDMMENGIKEAAVVMHGGAIMMLLAATAVPRKRSLEWSTDAGCGFSCRITPSLYHSSGIIEVYDEI